MIRGAGRLNKRMDERAAYPTPGEDRVVDGRHLMLNDTGSFFERPSERLLHEHLMMMSTPFIAVSLGPEWFQTPADADIARMEGEGGPPC